jgi:flagellar biosynthesis GTPase FlhF
MTNQKRGGIGAVGAMHANRQRIRRQQQKRRREAQAKQAKEDERKRRDALTQEERDAEDEAKRLAEEERQRQQKIRKDRLISKGQALWSEEAYKHFKNQWSGLSREKAIKWFNKKYSGRGLVYGRDYIIRQDSIKALEDFPGLNEAFTKAHKERSEKKGVITSMKKGMFGSNEPNQEIQTSNDITGGKKVRKHKGIIQTGGKVGKLRKGYRYSGKKLKSGLPQIVKAKSQKN